MSNYTKTTNFGAKDTLPSGDSQKIIRGTEFDTEFNNVATAIATKLEVDGSNNLAISGTFSSTKLIPTGGTATGNGMYLPAANAVAISTNGTERLRIDSSGVASFASNPILNGGTANGLVYLDGSKVATSGSAVTFDGTNLATTGTASATKLIPTGGTATGNGMYLPAANTLALSTNGVERVRVDSSGNLGVGTASPGAKLDIGGTNNTVFFKNSGATTGYALAAVSNTGGAFQYGISSSTGTFWGSGNAGNYSANIGTTTATNLGFGTNDTLRMLLDSSGNLGLGVTPSAWNSGGNFQLASGKNISAGNGIGLYANGYFDGAWKYINSVGAAGYVQSANEHIWYTAPSGTAGNTITFYSALTLSGSDTSSLLTMGRGFLTQGTGYAGAGSSTADPYLFYTNNTERARIDSSGNFSVGTTTTPTQITFAGSSGITYQRSTDNSFSGVLDYLKSRGSAASPTVVQNGDGLFTLRIAPYHGSAYTYLTSQVVEVDGTFTSGQNPPTRIAWYTNAANGSSSERARITSGGDLLVGTTAKRIDERVVFVFNGTTASGLNLDDSATTGTSNAQLFYRNAVQVGTITTTTTATAYNTSSDYRLKDNQQPLTGSGAFIDALQPKTWDWATDGSKGVGFIAHEVQTVSPNSVVGEKDAVDADGNPIMQAMEYGSAEFIANIVAELQSLRARVATLENN